MKIEAKGRPGTALPDYYFTTWGVLDSAATDAHVFGGGNWMCYRWFHHDRTAARYCRKGDLAFLRYTVFPVLAAVYHAERTLRTRFAHVDAAHCRRWYCAATPAVFTCLGVGTVPDVISMRGLVPPPLSRGRYGWFCSGRS
jgi:hypothetical protein